MILATMLTCTLIGQGEGLERAPQPARYLVNPWLEEPVAGPIAGTAAASRPSFTGSHLGLAEAEERAHTIVTGRAANAAGRTPPGGVLPGTCDIKFGESWKGPIPPEVQRRFALTKSDGEDWPWPGGDFIFFIARHDDADVIIKVLPRTSGRTAAIRRLIRDQAPPVLVDVADPDPPPALPGSNLSLDEATTRAHAIAVGTSTSYAERIAAGPARFGSLNLEPGSALKGRVIYLDHHEVAVAATGREVLPTLNRDYVFFFAEQDHTDAVIKVVPATPANLAAIRQGIAAEAARPDAATASASPDPAPAEVALPGSRADLGNATDIASVIFVGKAISSTTADESTPVKWGRVVFQPGEMLRGRAGDFNPAGIGFATQDREEKPPLGVEYLVFVARLAGSDLAYKVLPATPAHVAAARRAIRAHDDRTLPADQALAGRAHTIVVAEVTAGALVEAGGVGLGWCGLEVLSGLKGDAAAADGKRLNYTTYRGKRPPTVGQPYLVSIGREHDRDVILTIAPATVATIQAATRAEDNRRAIQAGSPRRLPGATVPLAAAAAKSPTIVVATLTDLGPMSGAGAGFGVFGFEVTSTLKGDALPGDRKSCGYTPGSEGIEPQVGESFLFFLDRSKESHSIAKMAPATPATIQAARDEVMAAGTPVAAR